MIVGLLAVLSASAAAGMRIALPLLILGLFQSDRLWSNVPLLSSVHPQVVLAILTSWSLFELFGSKSLLGQRVLQTVEAIFSPFVGALMGLAAIDIIHLDIQPVWLLALVGGLLAFVLKLVQIGWFFRLRGLPICLVFFAFEAPEQGGLIALFLLWIAIRSSQEWRRWYLKKSEV